MDFTQDTDATCHNEDEFISVGDKLADPWSRVAGKTPKRTHHDRHASANATFETFVNHDHRPVNDVTHGHVGWFNNTGDRGRAGVAGLGPSEEKSIRIDLKK